MISRPTTKCQFCNSVVRTDRLNHHIRKVHRRSVVTCPLCQADVSRSGLRKHIINVHEDKQQFISLHKFYNYQRNVEVYAGDENCQSLNDIKNECSNHELKVFKLPENSYKIREILKAQAVEESSCDNQYDTDCVVVITQTRKITLKNPSSEELKHWLREYKKWI